MMKRADSQLLVIFGASGDLTGRKLLPALFELFIGDMLPEHFAILGAARTGYTDEEFRAEQRKHILEIRKQTAQNWINSSGFCSTWHSIQPTPPNM